MKRLFEFIISGCWHKWADYETFNVVSNSLENGRVIRKTNVGLVVYCRCTKCGTHKRFNLY
jgi:hypothetical protein